MSADCEANYARMNQLAAAAGLDLTPLDGASQPDVCSPAALFHVDMPGLEPTSIELALQETSRYTATIEVRVHVECFGELGCTALMVRLYHDVNMAEVTACNGLRSKLASYQYPNDAMFLPDEKAQQNRFLAEWLGLCLARGLRQQSMPTLESCLIAPVSVGGAQGDGIGVARRPSSYLKNVGA